ncbi:Ff.00g004650.m01.CDS01 [Fusarium sp. VM40]|nr:Ff.00g004650.m01.CDS01 [Fusarium sp. VM40]
MNHVKLLDLTGTRVVVANSPELLIAAPDPSTSDLLPCSEDDWTAGRIGFNEALLTRNLHSPSSLGTFARACQAVHMLGKVLRHVQARARVEDVSGHTSEALQLHMALNLLDQGLSNDCANGSTVRSSQYLALSLCSQARLVLYNQYACNEPGQALPTERLAAEVEMQQISLAGIRELAAKRISQMAREIKSDNQQQSVALSNSPLLAGCLYHAATECVWFIKEDYEIEMVDGLESIVQALRMLRPEWSVCSEGPLYLP